VRGLRHRNRPQGKRTEGRFPGDFGLVGCCGQLHWRADSAAVQNVLAAFKDEAKSQTLIRFGLFRVVS
jgi:hypothetical protein